MTEHDVEIFVRKFADAWASRDGKAFLALWHGDGVLHSPFYSRPVAGRELGALNDFQFKQSPNLTWSLLGWTFRGDAVVVEWESTNKYGDHVSRTRGVDRFVLRDGKIAEEVVYADTATFRGMRAGKPLDALVTLPDALA